MDLATTAKLSLVPTKDLSVIIPVAGRADDPDTVYKAYVRALDETGQSFEIIYVVDGDQVGIAAALNTLAATASAGQVSVVCFNREFGEAACLREGVRRASGASIIFLPAYFQIDPSAIKILVDQLRTADVVAACRDQASDRPVNRLRTWSFERLARIAGSKYDDPGCVARAARRRVLDEVPIQDEQHRFLPLMAELHGFRVEQVRVKQAHTDARRPQHRPGVYLAVALDLLAVSFLLRFIQKPFRFFGSIGAALVLMSVVLAAYLVFERQVSGVAMSDRPLLVLDALLIVLGIQIAAIGLIAEIVIFTRGDSRTHYHIDTIVEEPDILG